MLIAVRDVSHINCKGYTAFFIEGFHLPRFRLYLYIPSCAHQKKTSLPQAKTNTTPRVNTTADLRGVKIQ